MTVTEVAPAKINLALHVRRRRPDGYHELETLFAFAAEGDVIQIERVRRDSFSIVGPFADVLTDPHSSGVVRLIPSPTGRGNKAHNAGSGGKGEGRAGPGGDNLVIRARDAFRTAFPKVPVAITLTKNLPIASGIGGGSADAAATLRALARLTGVAPDHPRLFAIAAGLGADVPACLDGRTTIGTGRGEALRPVPGAPGTPLLLVNPGVAVSTAAVFARWDGVDRGPLPSGDLLAAAHAGRNDLEPPARELAPVIGEARALLGAAPGATLSRMSGSGATCFVLFDTATARDAAARDAEARGWWKLATALR